MVVNLELEYFRPARLDDALLVSCLPERDGRVTLRFRQQIVRDSVDREPLVAASLRVACLDARTLRPRRVPDFIPLGDPLPIPSAATQPVGLIK